MLADTPLQLAPTQLRYLVKELLASSARLDGKLQLCIHGGNTNIDLLGKEKSLSHCE